MKISFKKYSLLLLFLNCFFAFAQKTNEERTKNFPHKEEKVVTIPNKSKVWVFMMAGQSNMEGRGLVEPQDTIANNRILTINSNNELVLAKEPIHFSTPDYRGLDCGMSFANELLKSIPKDVVILLLPTAVGGSPIEKWIKDLPHRKINLYSNFKEKLELGKRYGTIKAVLWHQGESDANKDGISNRDQNLKTLFASFRKDIGNEKLPILIGEIGSFSKEPELWVEINKANYKYIQEDKYADIVETSDLKDKGDKVHFDGESQREMGKRFVKKYTEKFYK
ncbi:sialate O-acetylesterase [Flavobacterium sufflavum]|uniref:Sialate O-acetylesterase n=2 Tax=Flavobacterium sufflavum TaxID=1921138 RepID=A0A437KLN5_9FLAO|nr:sialate O-acetylesterase [Flavobacterium sufflavum]